MTKYFNKRSIGFTGIGALALSGAFALVNAGVEMANSNLAATAENSLLGGIMLAGAAVGGKLISSRVNPTQGPEPK